MNQENTHIPHTVARTIGFDLVRAVEAASLHAYRWLGCGDKLAADEAATDAMRGMLNLIDMQGLCVIGEGIKDNIVQLRPPHRVETSR